MIELIIGLFTGVKNLVLYGLLLSYEIGKFIIKLAQIAWFILQHVYDVFQILLTVICEDFLVFLKDIYEHVINIIQFINSTLANTINVLYTITESVKYYLSAGKDAVLTATYNIAYGNLKLFQIVGQLFNGIKYSFILLGSGVWFLLTLIPLGIIYSFSLCTYYVGKCIDELIDILFIMCQPILKFAKDVIDFTFDVPFEATAGLIAGGCIIYLMAKFHLMAYTFLKDRVGYLTRYLRLTLRNNLRRSHLRVKTTVTQVIPTTTNSSRSGDVYCVICQEREKCILILPCKHLCLCSECTDVLHRYHSKCPVCRTYVHKTMKVFV